MKAQFYKYNNSESISTGANLFYSEYNRVLTKEFKATPIRNMISGNNVFCSNGPYSYLPAFDRLRNKSGFSITRDVQTGLWVGYFIQEYLMKNLQKTTDKIIFPSKYAYHLYKSIFPDLYNSENSIVWYPSPNKTKRKIKNSPDLILGYVGRISYDKNFDQVLSIFIKACKYFAPKKVKLICAGNFDGIAFENIVKTLKENDIDGSNFLYLGQLPHFAISEVISNLDFLLFPSCSSVETLGRVILEAKSLDVPVIAANYAAAPEYLSEDYLLPIKIKSQTFDSSWAYSLGEVDELKAIEILSNPPMKKWIEREEYSLKSAFYKKIGKLSKDQLNFIKRVKVDFKITNKKILEDAFEYSKKLNLDDFVLTAPQIAKKCGFSASVSIQ